MSKALPRLANLEQLRKQAKDLHRAHGRRDPGALQRVGEHLPRLRGGSAEAAAATALTLSEAQLVVAREYGFSSWPKLKHYVEALRATDPSGDPLQAFKAAVSSGDARRLRTLLAEHPTLHHAVNEPLFDFGAPAVVAAKRNLAVVDVLLDHGADINARSQWWAGGFGVLDDVPPEAAAPLIQRGAKVDIHAAAALGQIDTVAALLKADPTLVNAKGGDGQRPLHFAGTVEMIDLLLEHGAEIDARDVDHLGTPAQYKVHERELCLHLIRRGAAVDIFMACALGDAALVGRVLDEDPSCVAARIGDDGYAPVPADAPGGHIYMYKFAPHHSPHQVAARLAPRAVYDLLVARSPAKYRLLAAFDRGETDGVRALLSDHPALLDELTVEDRHCLAVAAWDNNLKAVRAMLDAGMDPHAEGPDRSTALDRAAWHGYVDIVRLLLDRDATPPLQHRNAYGATPLMSCMHGSIHTWHKDGDHAAVAEMLIAAGSPVPEKVQASEAVAAVLRRHQPDG